MTAEAEGMAHYGAERNRQMRPRFERMVERWTPCCLPGVYEG